MRLTIVLLGHTLDLSLEATADEEADPAAALNGGTLASAGPVEPKASDQFMGFTGGWESGDDDE